MTNLTPNPPGRRWAHGALNRRYVGASCWAAPACHRPWWGLIPQRRCWWSWEPPVRHTSRDHCQDTHHTWRTHTFFLTNPPSLPTLGILFKIQTQVGQPYFPSGAGTKYCGWVKRIFGKVNIKFWWFTKLLKTSRFILLSVLFLAGHEGLHTKHTYHSMRAFVGWQTYQGL